MALGSDIKPLSHIACHESKAFGFAWSIFLDIAHRIFAVLNGEVFA